LHPASHAALDVDAVPYVGRRIADILVLLALVVEAAGVGRAGARRPPGHFQFGGTHLAAVLLRRVQMDRLLLDLGGV
jgi:hypothetical protein